jgi:hypothetical protein
LEMGQTNKQVVEMLGEPDSKARARVAHAGRRAG